MKRRTVKCSRCGREIVVYQQRADGYYSEYVDAKGRCWECAKKK